VVVAGFLSWDKDSCHVDLEKELLALVAQAPEGEEARNGNHHHWLIDLIAIVYSSGILARYDLFDDRLEFSQAKD